MKLSMMYPFLNQELDQIEKELNQTIQAENPILREASTHLLNAGGKRIRPVFVLLSGKFGEYNLERIKSVAVSLELIHMASLVHDDVIDDAELRRGKPTIKSQYDNRVAMYTGDYMFARSLECLSQLEDTRAHQVLSKAMVDLCIGEIEQIKSKYDWDQNLRTYLRRIKRKTALLISVSCQLGAIAGKVPLKYEQALFKYGYYVGMSYQIIDDVLDFTASVEELGKPAGGDLMQGNITLPVLFAFRDQVMKNKIIELFDPDYSGDPKEIDKFLSEFRKSKAIDDSLEISERYLQKALNELKILPNSRPKQALVNIAKYIGKRKS
ncbi:heptaprenyl diphosphate synthase component II [Bacillaceae bacterium S4-13-58]